MLTLITFLQALILSGTIVYVSYCLMRFTAYCVLWLIEKLTIKAGGDPSLARRSDTPSHVAEDVIGLGQTRSAFPILRETDHASVE
jgi:hypothetical protein